MKQTIINFMAMVKKAIKKATTKKSDKPKSAKKPKAAEVKTSETASVSIPASEPVAPIIEAPISKPVSSDIDQWKKDHIAKHNITRPFFNKDGTVYRTSDGKAYSTAEEFHADGGQFTHSLVHGL